MANPEHLEILKQGVEAWNRWRWTHSEIYPDLSGADFRGADLRGAILRHANLREADLSEAFLHGADLREADLSETHFHNDTTPTGVLTPPPPPSADARPAGARGCRPRRRP